MNFLEIIIFSHGAQGSLDCNGTRLIYNSAINSKYPSYYGPIVLKKITAKFVFLFSCEGATGGGGSIAAMLSLITGGTVFAVKDGGVSVNYSTGRVKNKGGRWVRINSFSRYMYGVSQPYFITITMIEYLNIVNLTPETY